MIVIGGHMRRRLEIFIPIVLLAVLVQWLAPVAAFRMVVTAWSDPLSMGSICSGMASASDTDMPGQTSHMQADCCAFCAGHHGVGPAINPPSPVFATLQLQFQKIAWLEASAPTPKLRAGSNAQARAPPFLS